MNSTAYPKETPSDKALKSSLGAAFEFYHELNMLASNYKKDWVFLKGTGWVLFVNNENKDLFYLIPQSNYFLISLTLSEKERKGFLNDQDLQLLHDDIESASKFSEGYAMQFAINSKIALDRFKQLLLKFSPNLG